MSFRTHTAIDDTLNFLRFAVESWETEGVGTYLIENGGLDIEIVRRHAHVER